MEHAGDETISNLPNAAVTAALQQLLLEQFPKRKYTYVVQQATEKGENYLGVVYRILIEFDEAAGEPRQFSLILKVPPADLNRRKQFFARPCFLREALAYAEFLPLAAEFQRSKGVINPRSAFHEYPLCYSALTDEMDEAIFMEDLRVQKFELYDRFAEWNEEHAALVMHIYAKLHAVSFAMKDQQPEKMRKYQLMEDLFEHRRDDTQLNAYFETLKQSTLACLHSDTDARYVTILEKYFESGTLFDLLLELVNGKRCEPHAVVCHGDCWNNNILFKYEAGKVVDARLIDWQIMRYAAPVTDLMYFFFTCTTQQFRRKNYNNMLNVYYKELSEHMERLGTCPTEAFPRIAFDAQLKNTGVVGLLFAMIILPLTTIKSEDAPNLEELSAKIEGGATTNLMEAGFLAAGNVNTFSRRMRETVVDCIDFGYI